MDVGVAYRYKYISLAKRKAIESQKRWEDEEKVGKIPQFQK